jgi:hypothetical protein
MEPVDKRKLDREIKPSGAAENQESPTEQEGENVAEKSEPSEAEKPKFGRRRRRASSSGVLTPSS